jgi:hypothetical protein
MHELSSYREFESLSLRQLRRSQRFSAGGCRQRRFIRDVAQLIEPRRPLTLNSCFKPFMVTGLIKAPIHVKIESYSCRQVRGAMCLVRTLRHVMSDPSQLLLVRIRGVSMHLVA